MLSDVYFPHFNPNISKYSRYIEILLFISALAQAILFFINLIFLIFHHNAPNFVGSVLPENTPFLIKLSISYILPCYCILFMYMNAYVYFLFITPYILFILPFIILEFRLGRKSYHAPNFLREFPHLPIAYRTVQLFQLQVNSLFGLFLVPTQIIVSKLTVYSIFMLISSTNAATVLYVIWTLTAVGGVFAWGTLLLFGGNLYWYGKKILESWKYRGNWYNNKEKKFMSKFRRSCAPLAIAHGKTYVIKRLTVFKFLRGLSIGIFRTLLTLK